MDSKHCHSKAVTVLLERASAWKYLHDLFRKPTPEQWDWLHDEAVQAAWKYIKQQYASQLSDSMPLPSCYSAYESEYIATFETGLPQPPCPLVASHWNHKEPAPKTIHEHLIFYKRFGLQLVPPAIEQPDHLLYECEFMHYLLHLEAQALADGHEAHRLQLRNAQQDFTQRHCNTWLPLAADMVAKKVPGTWQSEWVSLTMGLAGQCS